VLSFLSGSFKASNAKETKINFGQVTLFSSFHLHREQEFK
jgi:hypothetical protein